jgi:DNA-binding NarL/FixJ family response regulator
MIRVVIGDDHTLMREGLKQLLQAEGLEVVAEACDGNEVIERVRSTDFDVLLLDLSMPGKSGLELIKWVREMRPKLRILVLSMHSERQYAIRAIRAGASGYLTKESAPSQLVAAIQKVAAGGAFVSPAVAEMLALEGFRAGDGPAHASLSDREYQVFRLLVAGLSVTDIAERLNLSSKTISTHKARLMEKMAIGSSAELVRYAITHGLVDDQDASG